MNIAELRKKTTEELKETVKSLKKDTEGVMNNLIKGKEKNVRKIGVLRKDLARVMTVLKEKKNA